VKLIFLGVVFFGGLTLGVCDDADRGEPQADDALEAIQLAILTGGLDWDPPPETGRAYSCVLDSQFGPVDGSCRWDALPSNDPGSWRVVFRETWACEQFSADAYGYGYPACSESTGFHEWVIEVNLLAGKGEVVDETGQFPPDLTR
jgi:hypothetical protein